VLSGLQAVWAHRLIHWLWTQRLHSWPGCSRSGYGFWTARKFHPGAVIGRRLLIDHGMGVVIGETSIVATTAPSTRAAPWAARARKRQAPPDILTT